MAITISKEPTGTYLNAYNNMVLEFTSNIASPVRALVELGGYTFDVTPNQGLFYINIRDVIVTLINADNFTDSVEVTNPNSYIYPDTTLYLEQDVKLTVIGLTGARDTLTKTYRFFKSVAQIIEPVFKKSDLFRFLVPSVDDRPMVTYFEGYPFDVTIYSSVARTVTITNRRTAISRNVGFVKGINRMFLSNGDENFGFENAMPLYLGLNVLEFTFGGEKETLYVLKKEYDCGNYIKFLNQSGGWSYWRMQRDSRTSIRSRTKDVINNDFDNIGEATSRQFITGKETQRSINVSTGKMNPHETLLLSHVFKTPKVYLLGNSGLQPFQVTDWKEVRINDGTNEIANTRYKKFESPIVINLPKDYSQDYAS